MRVSRELPGSWRKYGLMEQSLNSEGDILTNSKTQFTIKLGMVAERDNTGEMSAL